MSIGGNMMDMMDMMGGGGMNANSFTGQDSIAEAMMAMNPGGQAGAPPPMGGPMPAGQMGPPAPTGATTPDIEKDETQIAGPGGGLGSGGGGMAGNMAKMFMMFSDRRLKRNIKSVGNIDGVNLYSYNYIWDDVDRIGVMADEVPHAAVQHASGYMMVDYSKVF